jgi:DNA gyrase subunit A
MIITAKGLVIRMKVKPIKVIGRRTQGVRLIRIGEDDWITDVARVVKNGEEEEEGEAPSVEMPPDESTSDLFGM